MIGEEQGTNQVTIRDGPTIEQYNQTANNLYASAAFNVLFAENHTDKARRRLEMLSDPALNWLIHATKKLMVLARREQLERQGRKATR